MSLEVSIKNNVHKQKDTSTKLDFSHIQISGKYVFEWSLTYAHTMPILIDDITTRLLIVSCNNFMLTITTALYAGSVDHVI